ncbi:hypothetical protein GCM10025867_31420 [Frondihabitans sucicola]|uniref:Uncharacterized protein n=1 Tax=Frondihabitans sucicola TaxID=1268041 RepID=A0ABM8GR31_9MICO|nr:hypothetical protein GCM10025867_31420 [Frondihabitans sucicola]
MLLDDEALDDGAGLDAEQGGRLVQASRFRSRDHFDLEAPSFGIGCDAIGTGEL